MPSGQINSWVGKLKVTDTPCIGDTVRQVSNTVDPYSNYAVSNESELDQQPQQTASLWWLIAGGLVLGLLFRGRKS